MSLYKCFMCDGVFDSKEKPIRTVKDGPRDGELICPLCHAFEPGFEEIHCPTGKETKIDWRCDNGEV